MESLMYMVTYFLFMLLAWSPTKRSKKSEMISDISRLCLLSKNNQTVNMYKTLISIENLDDPTRKSVHKNSIDEMFKTNKVRNVFDVDLAIVEMSSSRTSIADVKKYLDMLNGADIFVDGFEALDIIINRMIDEFVDTSKTSTETLEEKLESRTLTEV